MFATRTNWNFESNRLAAALARHRAARKPLLDLTASNPTKCGFEYDSAEVLKALANRASLVYEPEPRGLECARRAVATYYADRGDKVAPEDIILTTSTSEAYSFVFRTLCNPGDEILVPAPSYPLFEFLADIQDVKLRRYPLVYDYGWQIDFPALTCAIGERTRAVIVVHPNNPTGHFCSAGEAVKLNEICVAQKLALIADEVFLDFAVERSRRPTFATNHGALTFTMSGISKMCGLPQMKLAWLVTTGPHELKASALARLEVIADTCLSMNAPIQHAASTLLETRHAFRRQLIERFVRNVTELDRQLSSHRFCERLKFHGGWYVVLRVPAMLSDEELAVQLVERKGVHVHPGHFYDFPSDGYLIVSLICTESEFKRGMEALLNAS